MNLNISINIMDYFQGNTDIIDKNCSKNEFSGLFEMIEESLGEIDNKLDINIEDSEGKIYDELLQNILNSLSISTLGGDLSNHNNIFSKSEDDINSLIDNLNNLDNDKLFNNLLLSKDEYVLHQSENIFDNLMQDIVVDDKLLNLEQSSENIQNNYIKDLNIIQDSYTKDLNSIPNDYIEDIQNIQSNSIKHKADIETQKNDSIKHKADIETQNNDPIKHKIDIETEKNNIIDAVNIEESYNKLEVNSLSNKSNLLDDNRSEFESDDLNTLESIAKENPNNFIGFNSITSKVENNSMKLGIESAPIREIRQENIEDDIVQTIRYLNKNGIEEIKVKINPGELGEMTIKVMKSKEETNLSITISNEDVYSLVNKNVGEITEHLKSLDINVKEVFVDIKSDNEQFFSDNLNQEFNKSNQNSGKQKKNKFKNFEAENTDKLDEIEINEKNLNILI